MIGVIGGSGFYSLLENAEELKLDTPYGSTSSPVSVGTTAGRKIAFIARHGLKHEYPPHKIPYKANIWALHSLGIKYIIAPCAVGSLKKEIMPGDFLVPDQFVNFTHARDDTFYHGPTTMHISSADPYCPVLRDLIISEGTKSGLRIHPAGTIVVIQGPRFATKAESEFYRKMGFDVITMTQYPECVLARELEMCYVNISIVTDYDTGLKDDPSIEPVSMDEITRVFSENNEKIKKLIMSVVPKIPENRNCVCSRALEGAKA